MLFPYWRVLLPILRCFTIRYCATTPGTFTFFLNQECSQHSVEIRARPLQTSWCGATDGVIGIAIETYPSCSSGKPIAMIYQDTFCSKPFGDNNITQNNSCFSVGANGISTVKVLSGFAAAGSAAAATSTSIEPTAAANLTLSVSGTPRVKRLILDSFMERKQARRQVIWSTRTRKPKP